MSSIFYCYVGYSDTPPANHKKAWLLIPDTAEAREQAISDGYTAMSTMSFEFEPGTHDKIEPTRRGDLVLDFDSKEAPEKAIAAARAFVRVLADRFDVAPDHLRYWMSGGKGCHLEIPAALYGDSRGDPLLPKIHRLMVQLFLIRARRPMELTSSMESPYIDMSMYCMGKGKLLRLPNIRRENGKYKVPVKAEEFFELEYTDLAALTRQPRSDFCQVAQDAPVSAALSDVFQLALKWIRDTGNKGNASEGLECLLRCTFMAHCVDDSRSLEEPDWWIMVKILNTFGEIGRRLIHLFSRDYPGYSFKETEDKIRRCQSNPAPITCSHIRSRYDCKMLCGVKGIQSPADLWRHHQSYSAVVASEFVNEEDGLYYLPPNGGEPVRLCTHLKFIAKLRKPDNTGWARLVEIQTPDGKIKQLVLQMKDLGSKNDTIRSLLQDSGVEICPVPKAFQLIVEYLTSAGLGQDFGLLAEKIGWLNNELYILPDMTFGNEKETVYFLQENDGMHGTSGSLEEWQERVGRLCSGNSILVLGVCFALTGPLLRPFGIEGGGLHIYGRSSSGKSTTAIVAGSVCGGGGNRGYIRQWRATHNAIEKIACMHNDNMLVLDEISQATSDTVSQVAYMLANGQGRARLKSDATMRDTATWLVNFLSTGEVPIGDKIEEGGRLRALAGQQVRVIDIPIDEGAGANAFSNQHGIENSQKFSETLSQNARKYYGQPLRAFLAAIFKDSIGTLESEMLKRMELFTAENTPENSCGQVQRVLKKFALIGEVGEYAVSRGILPFAEGEARNAAKRWFEIWLQGRSGSGDMEIIMVLRRIKNHFATHDNYYWPADSRELPQGRAIYGYTRRHGPSVLYLMLTPYVNEIVKGVNKQAVLQELIKRGWVATTSGNRPMETMSVNGRTHRGWVFIPSAWENDPDD